MSKKIFINFKMNKNSSETKEYLSQLSEINSIFSYVVFVNYLNLIDSRKYENSFLNIGAQSGYWVDKGNFTSKISIKQIHDENIKWILLGHCEDVKYNNLTDSDINLQIKKAYELDFNIVLCFGDEKYDNNINNRVQYLIDKILQFNLEKYNIEKITLAYEPIFAIGGSYNVNKDEIEFIIKTIKDYFNNKFSLKLSIIYGGSVNSTNFNLIYKSNIIDGVLIGSFAWDINNIKELENSYEK